MKKLFFLLAFVVGFGITSHAQTTGNGFGFAYKFPTVAGDTIVNADTVFKKITVTAGYSVLGVQVNIKKGTGTLSGAAYLYTSFDGVNYKATDTASYVAVVPFSTVIPTYTHVATFTKPTPAAPYYEVVIVSTGTLASSPVQVLYTTRKYGTSTL